MKYESREVFNILKGGTAVREIFLVYFKQQRIFMARKIISVKNISHGSISVDTIKGMVSMNPGEERKRLFVTDTQLARIEKMPGIKITAGTSKDEETTTLKLSKEMDLNVNVFDQEKINDAFDKIDAFAAATNSAIGGTSSVVDMLSRAALGRTLHIVVECEQAFEATQEGFEHDVVVKVGELVGVPGDLSCLVHTWINTEIAVTSSSNDGTVSIESEDDIPGNPSGRILITEGQGSFKVVGAGAWAAGNSYKLEIAPILVFGDELLCPDVIVSIPVYASTAALANSAVSVDNGTSEEDAIAELDITVGVVGTNSEVGVAAIAWTIAGYDGGTAGDYTATGVLTLPAKWTGTAPDVTATVTVKAAS